MKNLPRHTPGPWKADFPFVTTEDGTSICDVRHAGSFNKNEHLIAAAPDLLAALELIVTWQKRTNIMTRCGGAVGDIINRCEEAIAKAKGN